MRSIGHFIGGKEVKGTSGRTADVFEPMTGDVQAKVALASKAEVRAAVENARAVNEQRAGEIAPWHVGRVPAVKIRQSRYSSGSFDGSSLPVLTLGPFLSSCAASYY